MAAASGAQTERRGVPRPVRLPRGGEDAPAAFSLSLDLLHVQRQAQWIAEKPVVILCLSEQGVGPRRQSDRVSQRPDARACLRGVADERIAGIQLAIAI